MRVWLLILLCLWALPQWVQAADGPGSIEGRLVHKVSGEPVMGAPVQLDQQEFAVTSESGRFRFRKVSPGEHVLNVDDPECAPFEATVTVLPGQVLQLNYALDPRGAQDTETVVIRSRRIAEEVSDTVLQVEEVKKIPGTQGDILKIVQSLPGVAYLATAGGASAAGVVVRGAAPEDSQVLIDGHPVPLLYHFGNLKSILNSDMLKRIDFLAGGFGAEFGGVTGGVIDVQTLPSDHKRYDGYVELSMLDAGFFAKGPLGEDAGFVVAARRSTLDAWLPTALENFDGFELTASPVYYDYQAKVDWSPNPENRVSVLAFGSSDAMKFLFEKPISGDPSIRGNFGFATHFHRGYLSWTHSPQAADWQVKVSAVGGFDGFDGRGGSFLISTKVPSASLRADGEVELNESWKLRAGLNTRLAWYDLSYSIVAPAQEGTVSSSFTSQDLIVGQEDWMMSSGGAYLSAAFKPRAGTLIIGGLRFDGYDIGGHGDWAVMPRLSFMHELRKGTMFKVGVGLYCQQAPEVELSEGFGNPDLEMERAVHYTLGLEQRLPWATQLETTFFYKDLDKLVVGDEDDRFSNGGVGKISGLEILIRRDLQDGIFGWLAYTMMRSQRRDGPGSAWRLFDFDQTHILTLVAGYQLPTGEVMPNHGLRSGWEFGLRFQVVTGNPYTPLIGGIQDSDFDNYLPIPGPVNSKRLPLFHRLDLRVDYTWAFVQWALSVFLDVQNVYNHRAPFSVDYNYDYTQTDYNRELPIIPALGIRGSF